MRTRHMRRPGLRVQALALLLTAALTAAALAAPQIWGYQEGLAKATEGGLWGFANVGGEIVIPIQYQSVMDFSLGVARVQKNNKLGLIRPDGAELIQPEYDTLEPIGYGLYRAQKGDEWGVVSMVAFSSRFGGETQELYPPTYDYVAVRKADGLDVLVLTSGGTETLVPLNTLPALLVERKVPSARFPLVQKRLPNFSDVTPRDWYDLWVDVAYNVGLMEGVGDNRFNPNGTLTVAEALKLAAHMESRYLGDDFHLQSVTTQPWYRSSVAYCVASGIITEGEFTDYERPVTRAEMARIFAATALGRGMPDINSLERVKSNLPDVKTGDYAADAIYSLYAKGVFTGTDGRLTFHAEGRLTRAEAAAIVSRMARIEQRVNLWSTGPQLRTQPTGLTNGRLPAQ